VKRQAVSCCAGPLRATAAAIQAQGTSSTEHVQIRLLNLSNLLVSTIAEVKASVKLFDKLAGDDRQQL
jgi:hypothetical protein